MEIKTLLPTVELFIGGVEKFFELQPSKQTELIAYALQANGRPSFTAAELSYLREELNLSPFNAAWFLSIRTKKIANERPIFIKRELGYSLERGTFQAYEAKYGKRPTAVALKNDLAKHLATITDTHVKDILTEAANCFGSNYFRAAIVLSWAAGYGILREWLFNNHLAALNAVMATWNPPKAVTKIEEFDEKIGSERTVLDTAKRANALSKEEHKLLVALLDERNSYAHPSGRTVKPPIAEAFLVRVIDEVIAKFK